jgi:hypothetical protein
MTNEEQYIQERLGRKNPFRVPGGYFDSLTAEVMSRLPESSDEQQLQQAASHSGQQAECQSRQQNNQPSKSLLVKMRPWLYAAACLFVALLTATVYFIGPSTADQQVATTATPAAATAQESYVDEVADYVMADNMDIYACLSGEY